MSGDFLFRLLGPALLAATVALVFDRLSALRGLTPPAWSPDDNGLSPEGGPVRRFLALSLLTLIFYFAVLQPLAMLGLEREIDFSAVSGPELFVTHLIFVIGLLVWYLLGFWGYRDQPGASAADQLGLTAGKVWSELALGLVCGVVGWLLVIVVSTLAAGLIAALGGAASLPTEPSPIVVFVAGLPVALRISISLSAGVVEEAFFRGLLQPRVGVVLSTLLFAIGHLSYEQPTLLIGITALSLFFAALVQWRQSIWAAMTAHAVFDAIQLLILIPAVLDLSAAGVA
jgi:membrane protease YdiL (CAAX protease family)